MSKDMPGWMRSVEQRLRDMDLRLRSGSTDWVYVGTAGAPAFQNGWTNYNDTWVNARYRKINGIVYLHGLVKNGVSGPIFNLPVGFRPGPDTAGNNGLIFHPASSNVDTGNGTRVDVKSDGNVLFGLGGTAWCSLSGIIFPAEQ